jgi:hypothetical protein
MKVFYQVDVDDPATARLRSFLREAESWPFPNLPAPGDGVVIDIHAGGMAAEHGGGATVLSPTPGCA